VSSACPRVREWSNASDSSARTLAVALGSADSAPTSDRARSSKRELAGIAIRQPRRSNGLPCRSATMPGLLATVLARRCRYYVRTVRTRIRRRVRVSERARALEKMSVGEYRLVRETAQRASSSWLRKILVDELSVVDESHGSPTERTTSDDGWSCASYRRHSLAAHSRDELPIRWTHGDGARFSTKRRR